MGLVIWASTGSNLLRVIDRARDSDQLMTETGALAHSARYMMLASTM
jgi:hypothetical protein